METSIAQQSLIFLQGLTVECGHICHDISEGKGCSVCAPNCLGTVPKYPCLWYIPPPKTSRDNETPFVIRSEDIDLNDLLMDAAKRGYKMQDFMFTQTFDTSWAVRIHSLTPEAGEQVKGYAEANTPIKAVLVALSKAEGLKA